MAESVLTRAARSIYEKRSAIGGEVGGDARNSPRSNSPFSLKIALPSAQREHREL